MSSVDTEAVILRTYKLAEADKIVVCLTRSEGTIRGVAHGARRLKSRFGASLEPFTHVSLAYYAKEGRELVTLKRVEILKSYFSLSKDPDAFSALEYLGQLVIEFAPPHQPDEKLFRLVVSSLDAASRNLSSVQAIRPYFELWLLRLNGFLPDLRTCAGCRRRLMGGNERVFVFVDGTVWCEACDEVATVQLDARIHRQLLSMNRVGPADWITHFQALPRALKQELSRLANSLTLRALEKQGLGRANHSSTGAVTEPARS